MGLFFVFVLNGLSQRLNLGTQYGLVALVDGVFFEALPPLFDCGLMISHFFLLQRNGMIRYLNPKVNLLIGLEGMGTT